MLVLALDTASPTTSVAVVEVHDSELGVHSADLSVLAAVDVADARRPAEQLAPAIATALASARVVVGDLGLVAVGVGPGPFTGLRAGLVTSRVLARTIGVDVVGVVSLDAIALAARRDPGLPAQVVVATDARRREVYWAAYDGAVRVEGPAVSAPTLIEVAGRPVIGRGAALYPAVLGDPVGEVLDPPAWAVAQLAAEAVGQGRALVADPLYLRRPDIAEPRPRKRVSPR